MIFTYKFTREIDERHEETYEYKYEVPHQIMKALADQYHEECGDPNDAEHDKFIAHYGTNLDYYEEDDDFYDYAQDCMEDEAREAFENDKEFWESIQEAEEYRRDPYGYYGVSRWDFV